MRGFFHERIQNKAKISRALRSEGVLNDVLKALKAKSLDIENLLSSLSANVR